MPHGSARLLRARSGRRRRSVATQKLPTRFPARKTSRRTTQPHYDNGARPATWKQLKARILAAPNLGTEDIDTFVYSGHGGYDESAGRRTWWPESVLHEPQYVSDGASAPGRIKYPPAVIGDFCYPGSLGMHGAVETDGGMAEWVRPPLARDVSGNWCIRLTGRAAWRSAMTTRTGIPRRWASPLAGTRPSPAT